MDGDGWRNRAFGDGGYLDNKPFSYVVDALSWRLGSVPMERKLIYVEPAPAHPETEQGSAFQKPDALANALAALLTIPQDETIREDIEAVLARNRRIERVERIVRQVEVDIESRDDDPFARIELDGNRKVPAWRSRDMRHMVDYYGVAFLPYRHLRLMTVTDDIAERLAVWWDIDRRSDQFYALRALARAWREANFYEYESDADGRPESVNAFLDDYDVKYRLRRTGFILRKVHQLRSLLLKPELPGDENAWSDAETHLMERWDKHVSGPPMESAAFFAALNRLADRLGEAVAQLRRVTWQLKPPNNASRSECHDELIQTLRVLLGQKPDPNLKALTTKSGKPVELPSNLPPPSPLRTLQENVFTNAKMLFKYTKSVEPTNLQTALEADILALKDGYEPVIGMAPDGQMPLPQALLGNPGLRPCEETDEGGPKVRIEIAKVTLPGDADVLNTPEGKTIRKFLAEYFMRFDEYDQASFPLYYDTGTGEPSTVEIVRVSPEDAISLIDERNSQRHKLAGVAVLHFGAFLDEQWRRNDIMWGRLDGCERILATLFPDAEDRVMREALLQEAQCTIVREEMKPENYDQLIDGFTKALADEKYETLEGAFNSLWAKLALTDGGQRRTQIAQALKGVLSDKGMLDYVREHYKVERKPDTQATLQIGSRALTITGRILEEAEQRRRGQRSWMLWVTRAGRAVQLVLTISLSGSVGQVVFRHWLVLLYVVETLMALGGTLIGVASMRNIGVATLCVTFGLHISSLMIGDYIDRQEKWAKWERWVRWMKWTARGLALTGVLLIFFGAMAVVNSGLRGINCPGGHNAFGSAFDVFCKPKSNS
jgi:patatin-related protein